ncbi:MAG: hypothetical protein IT305_13260 [Chloroflexi bacterium]|nr:hypothetical protein [Chloroflexota bacterium]
MRRRGRSDSLPAPLTSFVGREREAAELADVLTAHRLVTLVGPPGVGKTRLALRVAEVVRGRFPDGVWLVELAPLSDPALVPQAVATVLGARESPGQSSRMALLAALRAARILVILDTCEHLVAACANLIGQLLPACPQVRIIATSREVLAVPGEVTWSVGPLRVPDPDPSLPTTVLLEAEAVRLFLERARQAAPGFEVTAENVAVVAQVCRRLDGIPLAIEMAAARVRALSVAQIAARLDNRFRLFAVSRGALPRQQTLRALIDWSYDLLAEEERVLLRRLSVFSGGWTLDAAEAVCAFEADEAPSFDQHDVLGLLVGLVDKSLVIAEPESSGQMRYRLLETLAEYGHERLAACQEVTVTRVRHAAYFLHWVECAEPELYGPNQATWHERLRREHGNLRTALTWYLDSGAAEALRLVSSLWWFWNRDQVWTEGREWIERALALPGSSRPSAMRARALQGAGLMAGLQCDFAVGRQRLEASIEVARAVGDVTIQGRSRGLLGLLAANEGAYAVAEPHLTQSLVAARDQADMFWQSRMLQVLTLVAVARGDLLGAEASAQAGLSAARMAGDPWMLALSLNSCGDVARVRGDDVRAEALYEESVIQFRAAGPGVFFEFVVHNLGYIALRRRDYRRARACFEEALAAFQRAGDRRGVTECVIGLAGVLAGQGRLEQAARLWGAGEVGLEQVLASLWPSNRVDYDRTIAAVRQQLDEAVFVAFWSVGRGLSLDEAVEEALAAAGSCAVEGDGATATEPVARLSPREREIVGLVGRGLTNREVAQRLVVSQRTIEWHVANILGKLGLENKRQLTVWALDHGLASTLPADR